MDKKNNGSDAIGRIFAAGYTGRGSDTCDSRPKTVWSRGPLSGLTLLTGRQTSSTTASELEKKLAEVQEQVDNANSSISSSMGEQYEIMEDFGGIKNPQDVLENQGAASSSNTLSDEEFTELANRWAWKATRLGTRCKVQSRILKSSPS